VLILEPQTTPKLSNREKRAVIYPYYAGYSEEFVRRTIEQVGQDKRLKVLDPWNGSGTTTFVAAALGHDATGLDLNPVLTIVARARLASEIDARRLCELANRRTQATTGRGAPLSQLARACEAIAGQLNFNVRKSASPLASLLLCSCFVTARQLFANSLSRNPTWFKDISAANLQQAIPVEELLKRNIRHICDQWSSNDLRNSDLSISRPKLWTQNILKARLPTESFDLVLTSPPYLTRLDYVKSSTPDLAVLQRLGWSISVEALRNAMIGSPLVGSSAPELNAEWGLAANNLIKQVSRHPSKASQGYYHRFYLRYFDAIHKSMKRIHKSLKHNGKAIFVAQSSHYKEIFIDLPGMIAEIGTNTGMTLVQRHNYEQNRSIITKNSRASASKGRVVESIIVLNKD
jgi:SAM-dependent methyltransferase